MQPYTSLRYILSFLWYTLGSVQALTYWIDSSCNDKLSETVMTEAIQYHSRANYRMHLDADHNQETAFNLLYKVPYANTTSYDEVKRITAGVGGFTLTNDHPNSNLRIYCDDDDAGPGGRWKPVPDIPNLPEGVVPNSRKTYGVDQEMYDPINGIRSPLYFNTKTGCKFEFEHTLAETFVIRMNTVGQNRNRATLTICDESLRAKVQSIEKGIILKQNVLNAFIGSLRRKVDDFQVLTSFTIAHELTHHREFNTLDVLGRPDSYGWKNLVNKSLFNNTDSLRNADHYAYFGLLARLADRKWRLSNDINEAGNGLLVYAEDIPQK